MNANNVSKILSSKMFVTLEELNDYGLSLYKINKLVASGELTKINKNCYQSLKFQGDESDFYYASAYVPFGVICLLSASFYYNLTTFRPSSIDVAIQRKSKVSTLPNWPDIKIHYFNDARFSIGIEKVTINGNSFMIYDVEKTVVDIVYYREKIGLEETKEILLNYLSRKNKNLNKLIRYSKELKCEDILRNYLEVLF